MIEEKNGHNKLVHLLDPISNQDYVTRCIWRQVVDDDKKSARNLSVFTYELYSFPDRHEDFPPDDGGLIRCERSSVLKLTGKGNGETEAEYLVDYDFRNSERGVLTRFKDYFTNRQQHAEVNDLQKTYDMRAYFLQLVKLEDLEEQDGESIAEAIYFAREEEGDLSPQSIIRKYTGLKELSDHYDFFEPMLVGIAVMDLGWKHAANVQRLDPGKWLNLLVDSDASLIVAQLQFDLTSFANDEIAANEFLKGTAMREFCNSHPFFPGLIRTMCRLHSTSMTRWKTVECNKKSFFSVADMVSDVTTGVYFLTKEGLHKTGVTLIGLVFGSLLLQVFSVVAVHKKNKEIMWREIFLTLSGFRPGVLHKRIITQTPRNGHESMDANGEAALFKGAEIIVESVPGAAIQTIAMLSFEGEIDVVQIVSLALSLFMVVSATVHIDIRKESDAYARVVNEFYYGSMPASGLRRIVFAFSQFLTSTSQFSLTLMKFGLLSSLKGGSMILPYLAFDYGLFGLYKISRCDWRYWLPISGLGSVVASILMRAGMYGIATSTSLLLGRHCNEIGGAYWIFAHVKSHCEMILLVHFGTFVGINFGSDEVRLIAYVLCCMWSFGFFVMLGSCEFSHIGTFFSTWTGPQYAAHVFKNGTDCQRSKLFEKHRSYYQSYETELGAWLEESWDEWVDDSPQWFNGAFVKRIPDDLKPKRAERLVEETNNEESSVAEESYIVEEKGEDDEVEIKSESEGGGKEKLKDRRRSSFQIIGDALKEEVNASRGVL